MCVCMLAALPNKTTGMIGGLLEHAVPVFRVRVRVRVHVCVWGRNGRAREKSEHNASAHAKAGTDTVCFSMGFTR